MVPDSNYKTSVRQQVTHTHERKTRKLCISFLKYIDGVCFITLYDAQREREREINLDRPTRQLETVEVGQGILGALHGLVVHEAEAPVPSSGRIERHAHRFHRSKSRKDRSGGRGGGHRWREGACPVVANLLRVGLIVEEGMYEPRAFFIERVILRLHPSIHPAHSHPFLGSCYCKGGHRSVLARLSRFRHGISKLLQCSTINGSTHCCLAASMKVTKKKTTCGVSGGGLSGVGLHSISARHILQLSLTPTLTLTQ